MRIRDGKDKTLGRIQWRVKATRPLTAREWTLWEIDQSRQMLASSADVSDDGEEFSIRRGEDLENALTHAVTAWCRTHLRCKDASSSNDSYFKALNAKAPEELVRAVTHAKSLIYGCRLDLPGISTPEVVTAVRSAVEALLEAASRPPRNRRRFPAHLRMFRTPRKPRVKPGSWIDTGRYRPALVLEIMPEPPHTMKLSYGDETDNDFCPHGHPWASIRRPKQVNSLKDVFSAGDWFRHPYSGYGRVLEVRNSTMDVEYQGRRATVVPDPGLRRFEKVDGPEPEDTRPPAERFPPGTWIDQGYFGRGIVLGTGGEMSKTLTVLFSAGVLQISGSAPDKGPVIWKLDKKPLDLSRSWGRRWAWWLQHKEIISRRVCYCCGYPHLGDSGFATSPRVCIICGYPDFGFGFDDEPDEVCVCHVGNRWWHRSMWEDDYEWDDEADGPVRVGPPTGAPNDEDLATSGYSLSEARQNYEARGTMFRPDSSSPLLSEAATALRVSLVQLLEMAMAEPSLWTDGDRTNAEQIRGRLLAELSKAEDCP